MSEDLLFKDAFLASVYDAWYPPETRDYYAFYLNYAMSAQRVLDIGCGTGTFLHAVRSSGHTGELTGMDPNPGVLELARRYRNITWIQGKLENQPRLEMFDLVVMTGHAFQTVLGRSQTELFLDAVARCLRVGGVFAFESRNPAARAWEDWARRPPARIGMPEGKEVTATTHLTSDFDGETVSFIHSFHGDFKALPLQSESTLQFWSEPILREMLEKTGFTIEAEYGDFAGSQFETSSPEIVIIARRR